MSYFLNQDKFPKKLYNFGGKFDKGEERQTILLSLPYSAHWENSYIYRNTVRGRHRPSGMVSGGLTPQCQVDNPIVFPLLYTLGKLLYI